VGAPQGGRVHEVTTQKYGEKGMKGNLNRYEVKPGLQHLGLLWRAGVRKIVLEETHGFKRGSMKGAERTGRAQDGKSKILKGGGS